MIRSLSSFTLAAICAVTTTTLPAQPNNRPERPAERLTEDYEFNVGYSASGGVEGNGGSLGDVAVTSFGGSVRTFRPLDRQGRGLILGLAWEDYQLDVDPGVPLPDQLRELQLVLGLNYPLNERWTAGVLARPGLASDFDSITSDDVNLPVLLSLRYTRSPELVWLFGLNVDPFSEYPVIPLVGVRWQFAPQWTFSLGLPRTGVAYAITEKLTLNGGVSMSGGSFHVGEAQAPGIRDTLLSYREIRVGVSADYHLSPALAVGVEMGSTVQRKFDYFDRDFDLDGDNVGYLRLSVSGKF